MISHSQRAVSSLLSVAGAAMLVLASDPAVAAQGGPRVARIERGDLDLSSPAGVATFDRRVSAAADAVCEPIDGRFDRREAACRASVADQARRGAGLPAGRD